MKGGPRKSRKREPKQAPTEELASVSVSTPATEASKTLPGRDNDTVSQGTVSSPPCTPKRSQGRKRQTKRAFQTSTPVHSPSTDILTSTSSSTPAVKPKDLECTQLLPQLKTSVGKPSSSKSESQNRRKRGCPSQPRQLKKRAPKVQTQTCSQTNGPPAKSQRGRSRKMKTETLKETTQSQRGRFELEKTFPSEEDESLLSSDLSIELSHHEEQLPSLYLQDEEESEEEEEDEDLPSFTMTVDKKPSSIIEGVFVWSKYRHYPFWPALVKSVNRRQKKANILFIDYAITQTKKGFAVALKSLKPFDCEEANELVCKAKEEYEAAIRWSLELIKDYRIRIACGSFSGSFIEYFDHDMSYPVRSMYPQAASERLTIASDMMEEDRCDDHKEDSFNEQQEDVGSRAKRLLPDRSHAAHNRANEKLVHFIVKQHMVDKHLLAVIRGQQQSRWFHSFLSARQKRVVNIYLEDDQQLDQVYWYLNEFYTSAVATAPCLAEVKFMERVRFVLDVLLPEAIIYAIAGVDNISIKKAEEKYLKGRCISNRERQAFDLMIDRQVKEKLQNQKNGHL
ncbi:PWWP domain-containing DNA repair factor 3A isoform X2 [Parambassis ranga]|nr:PWWP domain-containing DNA repair factor 3A-like isoform X2 [Parambassis ranga]